MALPVRQTAARLKQTKAQRETACRYPAASTHTLSHTHSPSHTPFTPQAATQVSPLLGVCLCVCLGGGCSAEFAGEKRMKWCLLRFWSEEVGLTVEVLVCAGKCWSFSDAPLSRWIVRRCAHTQPPFFSLKKQKRKSCILISAALCHVATLTRLK